MACMDSSWSFNCPQFVDFTTNFEETSDDSYFISKTPGLKEKFKLNGRAKASSMNVICLPSSQLKNEYKHPPKFTDSQTLMISKKLSKRLSKSDGDILNLVKDVSHSIASEQSIKKNNYGISSKQKSKTNPMTPMCLRRTLLSTKTKKIKTSEELEMEKIAELQKRMHHHLRSNELNFKRLIQKQEVNFDSYKKKDQSIKRAPLKLEANFDKNKETRKDHLKKLTLNPKECCFQIPAVVSLLKKNKNASGHARKTVMFPVLPSKIVSFSTNDLTPSVSEKLALKPVDCHTGLRFRTNGEIPDVKKNLSRPVSSLKREDSLKTSKGTKCNSQYDKENILVYKWPPSAALTELLKKRSMKNIGK